MENLMAISKSETNNFPEENSDVSLMVEGENIPVNRYILSIASPVFKAMFSSEFEEQNKSTVELPDKKYRDVVEFLKWIYPTCRKELTDVNVYGILPLADEYQLEWLKLQCEEYLVQRLQRISKTPSVLMEHLYLADRHNLRLLEKACQTASATIPFIKLQQTKFLQIISKETHDKLLESKVHFLDEALTGFVMTQRYCHYCPRCDTECSKIHVCKRCSKYERFVSEYSLSGQS